MRRYILVLSLLIAAGCDPMFGMRFDVREGPVATSTVARIRDLGKIEGAPIEGARIDFGEMNPFHPISAVGTTGPDGCVVFGPFVRPYETYDFRCTKAGYVPVAGQWVRSKMIQAFDWPPHKTIVVFMRRAEP